MKIRNYITLLFAVVSIFLLLALAGYLTFENVDDANPVKQSIANLIPATAVPAHSIIFVGDSRTVSMGNAVQDNCTYIGKEGEGYRWFSSDGVIELTSTLENDPTQTVVYNLGVNDPENASLYVDLYQSIARQYTDTPFYYL